jgi:hypothetical protein
MVSPPAAAARAVPDRRADADEHSGHTHVRSCCWLVEDARWSCEGFAAYTPEVVGAQNHPDGTNRPVD